MYLSSNRLELFSIDWSCSQSPVGRLQLLRVLFLFQVEPLMYKLVLVSLFWSFTILNVASFEFHLKIECLCGGWNLDKFKLGSRLLIFE